ASIEFNLRKKPVDFDNVRINWRTSIINGSRDFKVDFAAHPELIQESNLSYWKKIKELLAKNRDDKINEANFIDQYVRTLGVTIRKLDKGLEKKREELKKKKFEILQKYREEMGLQLDEKNCVICYEGIARLPIFKARELVKFGCACSHFVLYSLEKKTKLAKKCRIDEADIVISAMVDEEKINAEDFELGELSKLTVQATTEKIAENYDIHYYNSEKDKKAMFTVLEKILLERNKIGIFDVEFIEPAPVVDASLASGKKKLEKKNPVGAPKKRPRKVSFETNVQEVNQNPNFETSVNQINNESDLETITAPPRRKRRPNIAPVKSSRTLPPNANTPSDSE
ncbi:hypothetical protein RFI_29003, partial [Reticulomyxa filosa]